MNIRKVDKKDYEEIYDLVEEAFKTAEVSDGTEQDFALKLRESSNYISELEFVAEENNELIGHIMFTKQKIEAKGEDFIGLLIAPLCVKLEYRNSLIGSKLIKYGFKKAKELNYKACFLIGNPKYYNRFGFKEVSYFNIKNLTKIPNEFVLACEIEKLALSNINGIIKDIPE